MTHLRRNQVRGFSLLEVLIAVIIMSVGLLALASLQLALMRASSDSKAQSVALALAKEELEDMRSFQNMAGYIAVAGATSTVPVGGDTFTVTSTVTRYALDNTSDPAAYLAVTNNWTEAQLTAGGYVIGKDFKLARVDVSWTEAGGTLQHVILNDVIDGLDPTDSARLVRSSATSAARRAKVIIFDPGTEAGVIPIAIDPASGTSTAATNPKPVINDSGTETRFNVLTYAGLTGGLAQAQAKVETLVVGCTCDTATKPTATTARGYRPAYWNGTKYAAPALTSYVPLAGQSAANVTSESPNCELCCRDHHDPGSIASGKPKFSPRRTTHTHYINNSGVFTAVGSTQTKYNEACRIIRVDGIYRVAADFNNEYFNLLETGTTPEYAPSTAGADNYEAFVLSYLNTKVVNNSTSSTYNNAVAAGTVTSLESTNNINNPTSITLARSASAYKWLHSRGLYHDFLESDAIAAITTAKANCVLTSCTTAQLQAKVLAILPFTSINVTELSKWGPTSSSGYVTVLNGSFASALSSTDPVRGRASPIVGNLPATAVTATGTSTQNASNSGLAPSASQNNLLVDSDESVRTDSQAFAIPAGGPSSGTNFSILLSGYGDNATQIPTLLTSSNGTCQSPTTASGVSTFSCNASSDPLTFTVSKFNLALPLVKANSNGKTIVCTGVNGNVNYVLGTNNSDKAMQVCRKYAIDSVVATGSSVITPGTPSSVGLLLESRPYDLNPVTASGTVTVTFGAATDVLSSNNKCEYIVKPNGSLDNTLRTSGACP